MRFSSYLTLGILLISSTALAQDKATPEDVYEMVIRAYQVVKSLGDDALPAFNDPKGEFVSKDTYVFVLQCPEYVVAHPFALDKLKGKDMRDITPFHTPMCEGGENPNGTWIEYQWPKPGETQPSRKISFTIRVQGTPYTVASGIYNDDADVRALNASLKNQ